MLELDFELRRGTFRRHVRIKDDARVIALVGPSGAGKTSVLNAIAGLVTPVAGRIDVDGRSLFDSTRGIDVPVHRRRVGYVFQDARLFPHLDVRRNLLYGRHGGHGVVEIVDDLDEGLRRGAHEVEVDGLVPLHGVEDALEVVLRPRADGVVAAFVPHAVEELDEALDVDGGLDELLEVHSVVDLPRRGAG